MPALPHDMGGRLPLLDPAELAPDRKKTYDLIDTTMVPWAEKSGFQAKAPDGRLIGPFNPILFSPGIADAFLALQEAEKKHTTLTARVREVVILSVGAVWQCAYELYAHSAVARKAGISEAAITALVNGEAPTELDANEQLACRFATQLTAQRRIDDALYAAADAAFGTQGIVDMIFLAGCYDSVSSLLNTFKVPAPE